MHGRLRHEIAAFQRRLDRQADATRPLRQHLYARAGLHQAHRVLDVGCGSGAVTQDLATAAAQAELLAVDVAADMVQRSRASLPQQLMVAQADGAFLPFSDGSFDVVACNLVLLWAQDPARLVGEMVRVVRPGGTVIASLEPDYGGKVHWPENPLVDLVFQGEGIARRGGDPHAGRKLRHWFSTAGLRTDVGILNPDVPSTDEDLQMMRRNRHYYRRMLCENGFGGPEIDAWEQETWRALEAGIQLSFLPCFWAIGRKPMPGDLDRP